MMWVGKISCWVISSINRVYEAVSRVAIPVKMIVGDQLNSAIITVNSAIRFVVGGGGGSHICDVSWESSSGY